MLEPGQPHEFIHPIVRSGIYSELSGAERAQAHRRAARLLAGEPGASERVAQHLLVSEPAGDGWVVERVTGSHHVFKHPTRPATIVLPHPKKDLGRGLVRNIYKQAGWEFD